MINRREEEEELFQLPAYRFKKSEACLKLLPPKKNRDEMKQTTLSLSV